MTSKQCNSCKYHLSVKEIDEGCYLMLNQYFMKRKNCPRYRNGELNEAHKEVFKNIRRQYPFTEIR